MSSCLLIGSGICGLTAAFYLRKKGHQVTLLDKGRGVGGRMASKSIGQARFDYGVPSFTVETSDFQEFISGIVAHQERDDLGRVYFRGGMSSFPKAIARELTIYTQQKVAGITRTPEGWVALCEGGDRFTADTLFLTLPVPQALVLLENSGLNLPEQVLTILHKIEYAPAFVHMGGYSQEGIAEFTIDNQARGVSEVPSTTVYATDAFTEQWLDTEQLPHQAPGKWHRWRYSQASVRHDATFLTLADGLFIGGDAFGKGGVEGAYLSGKAMAFRLRSTP